MLRLSRFLCSSSTGRAVGRTAGAPFRRRGADANEGKGRSHSEIILPWNARRTYDIHTNEWKYLDRMLAGVIGMTAQEVSERSLRLIGRDLLSEVEDPVLILRQQRFQQPKLARPPHTKVLLTKDTEPMTSNHRNSRQARKEAKLSAETTASAPEGRLRRGDPREEKTSRTGSAPSSASSSSLADANDKLKRKSPFEASHISLSKGEKEKEKKKTPTEATGLSSDRKKVSQRDRLQPFPATAAAAMAQPALVTTKSLPKKSPLDGGMGARKKMPSRKVKDKSEISVHLV